MDVCKYLTVKAFPMSSTAGYGDGLTYNLIMNSKLWIVVNFPSQLNKKM